MLKNISLQVKILKFFQFFNIMKICYEKIIKLLFNEIICILKYIYIPFENQSQEVYVQRLYKGKEKVLQKYMINQRLLA